MKGRVYVKEYVWAHTGATVSGALATALADAGTLTISQTGTNDGTIAWS